MDHIHTIKQLIEKCNEYNRIYYLGFVDYNKAFDSIKHKHLWEALKQQGVQSKYIRIMKQIYKNSSAIIRLEKEGEEFPIKKGVRQGDPLSPKLFSAVLEKVFQSLDWDQYGLNINGTKINHLRFADDLILITDNPDTLETMLQELAKESAEVGLGMNTLKTKLMTNGIKKIVKVDSKTIEYVEDYTYLGQIISPINQMSKEVDQRVTNSWKRYWSLKEVMKNRELPISAKRKVFDSCILPCMTYGCQTWSLTKANSEKLQVCQRSMERSMLNIKRKDRNSLKSIRQRTKVKEVSDYIKKLKWCWTGHIMRDKRQKWTKELVEWYPREGKRVRGRQRKRWEDDLKEVAGPTWRRLTLDRTGWKSLEEAYVSRQAGV